MKIILQDNFLGVRGTTTALYDYAFFLKQKYNYECAITFDETDTKNDKRVLKKFSNEFALLPYTNFNQLDGIINTHGIDMLYITKAGNKDNKISNKVKTCVHAVFPCDKTEKHGDVYAYISKWLSEYCSNGEYPYVPYMLNLPRVEGNYREALNIPIDAKVFGRYGGIETFDIQFAATAVQKVLSNTLDVYFLFCNTYKFIDHPRAIFVNSTASLEDKVRFINTCDAFLHARARGETFGLAVLEFMSRGKPVLTYGLSDEKNHYELLGKDGLLYNTEKELCSLLLNFVPYNITYPLLDTFLPDKVIEKFNDVFIKN
jgi:glycosyltransferase involved in cell wall biosynthesis